VESGSGLFHELLDAGLVEDCPDYCPS
jgi:hypothetical protein